MSTLRMARLPEVAEISRAKKGQIYPGGETLIVLSAAHGCHEMVKYHGDPGEISTRYAVAVPDERFDPEYFFIAVTRGLPEFIHKYLTTINLQIDALKFFKVEYHDSREDQLRVVESIREADKMIEAKEREINALQELKRFYQAMMFPSAK